MAEGPLNGVRILDFTHVWAGPLGTRILADLGAEIVKVEAPWVRGAAGPALPSSADSKYGDDHWNRQGATNKLNRNKRGLCLNSKSPEGHDILIGLVKQSDVVIENFSANAMASMGLGWDVLKSVNPNLIYLSMPGFGHSGPYRDFVAYGTVVEPMCGLTALMGYGPDEPRVTATAIPDPSAGVTAAAAIVTALHRRDQQGVGGFIELALQEAAMALFGEYFLLDQMEGPSVPQGNAHSDYAPSGVYACAGDDEWIAITARNEDDWLAIARDAGQGWESDARFVSLAARHQHRQALDDAIGTWTRHFDKMELMARLQALGVPAGAVMVTAEFIEDPQTVAREFFVELGGEHIDTRAYPGLPLKINDRRAEDWQNAPRLGQHNREILRELLDMDDASIAALEEANVITDRPPD